MAEREAFEPKHQTVDIAMFCQFSIRLCVTLCVAVCVTYSSAKFCASGGSPNLCSGPALRPSAVTPVRLAGINQLYLQSIVRRRAKFAHFNQLSNRPELLLNGTQADAQRLLVCIAHAGAVNCRYARQR